MFNVTVALVALIAAKAQALQRSNASRKQTNATMALADATERKQKNDAGVLESNLCSTQLVFGVGVFKTGTTSLGDFLRKLGYHLEYGGYGPIWHQLYKDWTTAALLEFLKMAEQSSLGNPFMRLSGGSRPVAYTSDAYLTAFSCQLSRTYPNAKFVLTTRDFDLSWPGIQKGWCSNWSDEFLPLFEDLKGHEHAIRGAGCGLLCNHALGLMKTLCSAEDLCINKMATLASTWDGVRESWRSVTNLLNTRARECIPPDRLLEVSMDKQTDVVKASNVQSFLGCTSSQQSMPRLNHNHDLGDWKW